MSHYLVIKYLQIVYTCWTDHSYFILWENFRLSKFSKHLTKSQSLLRYWLIRRLAHISEPNFFLLNRNPTDRPLFSFTSRTAAFCILSTPASNTARKAAVPFMHPTAPGFYPAEFTSWASALCSLLLAVPHLTAPSAVVIWSNRSWSHWDLTGEVWTNASYEQC